MPRGNPARHSDDFVRVVRRIWSEYAQVEVLRATSLDAALFKARKTAEAISKSVFIGENLKGDKPVNEVKFHKVIQDLKHKKAVPPNVGIALETIQQYGNFGVHDQGTLNEQITEDFVETCVRALSTVADWYFNVYCEGVSLSESGVHPVPRESLSSQAAQQPSMPQNTPSLIEVEPRPVGRRNGGFTALVVGVGLFFIAILGAGGGTAYLFLRGSPAQESVPANPSLATDTIVSSIPQVKSARPQAGPVVPRVEPVIPQVESAVPQVDTAVPRANTASQQAKSSVPHAEPSVPRMEPVIPQTDVASARALVPKVYVPPQDLTAHYLAGVNASSVYRPVRTPERFTADKIADGDPRTTWGVHRANVIGEWFEVHFNQTVEVTSVELLTGFCTKMGGRGLFRKNRRIKQASFVVGVRNEDHTFDDDPQWQKVQLSSPAIGQSIRVTILETYESSHSTDLHVSEIRVWGHPVQ